MDGLSYAAYLVEDLITKLLVARKSAGVRELPGPAAAIVCQGFGRDFTLQVKNPGAMRPFSLGTIMTSAPKACMVRSISSENASELMMMQEHPITAQT